MTKAIFLESLENKLKGLPQDDISERVSFYEEMINDRIDEGKSDEEAVNEIGTVDEVVEEILRDTPLTKIVKERIKPKRKLKAWEIVLMAVGAPLWLPLLIVALALAFVFYILIWVFVIVAYSVEVSLVAASIYGIVGAIFGSDNALIGLGVALLSAGGAMLLFFGCKELTKVTIKFSKMIIVSIKKAFIKKGE